MNKLVLRLNDYVGVACNSTDDKSAGEREGDLILTLQKSLKTITLEKSRKETAFAADKKQLLVGV